MHMPFSHKLSQAQTTLQQLHWNGWLLYNFRKSNDLACQFLDLPHDQLVTRRWFYWIPAAGQPRKLVHRIENHVLDHLPGEQLLYSSWHELEHQLKLILQGGGTVAMEYSPRNAIPYVSKVDAGTVELVRSCGVDVVSSADLLQQSSSVWTAQQLHAHLEAAKVLEDTVDRTWELIASSVGNNLPLTEWDVQQFMLREFEKHGCYTDAPPICARNQNSALPHFSPHSDDKTPIQAGDFVLIDLWCKKKRPHAVYADITRVGVVASRPNIQQQEVFNVVKAARDTAMQLIADRLHNGLPLMGCEVDQACRDVIMAAGYGDYFTHRTGHNIGENDHGNGANIDNFETQDQRTLLPGSCFSIEPGIYLPKEFGVRLEHDVYLETDGRTLKVTGGLQTEIACLL